jgi:hypothetical protein
MTSPTITLPHRVVVLIAANGNILTHFSTDRIEFPAIATHDRDRIFSLIFTGDLAALPNLDMPAGLVIEGAMYKEVAAWRISHKTVDKPRPRKRAHKSAQILPFLRKEATNG